MVTVRAVDVDQGHFSFSDRDGRPCHIRPVAIPKGDQTPAAADAEVRATHDLQYLWTRRRRDGALCVQVAAGHAPRLGLRLDLAAGWNIFGEDARSVRCA